MDFLLSCLFGIIGTGYVLYGRKQSEISFMLAGGLLWIFPYIVSGDVAIFAVGLLLMIAPFIAKHYGW